MTCFKTSYSFAVAIVCCSLSACLGYVPGAKVYWDARVKEMCLKDGGATVYERVKITPADYQSLRGSGGTIPVPARRFAKPDSPYVADTTISTIHEWGPEVFRLETLISRVADGRVLARQVTYIRRGGDFPSPSHSSSYSCSDVGVRLDVERQTFEIVGSAE